ncbi:hypothetical protein [Microbacterium hominis]|uniref:Uncharacterized protein n=1 Tax=Microbacterium hominis TaxID=162426 RepID=A0A0B4C8A9_9MICO|nr:hypothetical protein [Microbacterium hominis]KIC57269.1 hypothetical protein RM52_09525 [Microbacterium hominis]
MSRPRSWSRCNAGAQAAFVAVAPRLPLDAGAIALAVASGLVMLVATAALWTLALRAVSARAVLLLAAGSPPAAATAMRRHPWRTAAGLVVTAVAVILATIVAMLLGLLVTGALGAAAACVLIGVGAIALIGAWARWARTGTSVGAAQP